MDATGSQRFFPASPSGRQLLPEESELQVRSVTDQLMREFAEQQSQLSARASSVEAKKVKHTQLRATYDSLKHSNRLRETKVRELKEVYRQIVILNGGEWEEIHSPRSSISLKVPVRPEVRIASLTHEIAEVEDDISNEYLEHERFQYLFENTNKAMLDSRTRCRALQRQSALILGKCEEIQDIEAKSRYDLQHAKSQTAMFSEQFHRDAEKRKEKLQILRKDLRDLQENTALSAKALAEEIVREQASKDVADLRAQQLDAIYDKHVHSLTNSRLDRLSKESVTRALRTICTLLNSSQTLRLSPPLESVSLSDLITYSRQFEMKMSSLELQVQSLSEWKAELEARCNLAGEELQALTNTQFQSETLVAKIQARLKAVGVSQPVETYNQMKTYLESLSSPGFSPESAKYEAFLASSFLTLNIVTKRLLVLLDYIQRQIGAHPPQLTALTRVLSQSQKLSERFEQTYLGVATPTASSHSEVADFPPAPDTDLNSANLFFREALQDVADWGLNCEELVRDTGELLLVRIFGVDARLRDDVRKWKLSAKHGDGEELKGKLLGCMVGLAHKYLTGRLEESFGLMRSVAICIAETNKSLSEEVAQQPLTEAQLSVFVDFTLSQQTGGPNKPLTVTEKAVHDIIKTAFDKKYKKLMLQQRHFHLEEESAEFLQKYTKKRHESMTDGKESEVPELAKGEEDSYAQTMRKHAKSAGNASVFLPKTAQRGTQRPVAHFDAAIGAFAQMRSVNVRIRAIKDSERAPLSLPDLRLTATNSPKSQSTDRHLIRAIHSSRKL